MSSVFDFDFVREFLIQFDVPPEVVTEHIERALQIVNAEEEPLMSGALEPTSSSRYNEISHMIFD
jgi:hypothetical protein